jgi:hypothetical protein
MLEIKMDPRFRADDGRLNFQGSQAVQKERHERTAKKERSRKKQYEKKSSTRRAAQKRAANQDLSQAVFLTVGGGPMRSVWHIHGKRT